MGAGAHAGAEVPLSCSNTCRKGWTLERLRTVLGRGVSSYLESRAEATLTCFLSPQAWASLRALRNAGSLVTCVRILDLIRFFRLQSLQSVGTDAGPALRSFAYLCRGSNRIGILKGDWRADRNSFRVAASLHLGCTQRHSRLESHCRLPGCTLRPKLLP